MQRWKIIDFSAKVGYETLKRLIPTDEGAAYLGAVALVPHDSPISMTKTTDFNTRFDENAACHFAIGNVYRKGTQMSKEELEKHGANTSLTHVDFMVGSGKFQMKGDLLDGTPEDLFIKGNWA